jgi:hypothetical protein
MKIKITELLALLLMALLFLSIPYYISQSADPHDGKMSEGAIIAHLQSISVPLYSIGKGGKDGETKLGEKCHGFNSAINEAGDISFVVTAGHCGQNGIATKIPGTQDGAMLSIVSQSLYGDIDYLIGTKPFCGNMEKLAKFPKPFFEWLVFTKGETYYALGTDGTIGKDGDQAHGLTKLIFVRKEEPNRLVFSLGPPEKGKEFSLDCKDNCAPHIKPGISGSVIVNARGEAVGIANGFSQMSIFEVYGVTAKLFLPQIRSVQQALGKEKFVSGFCEGGTQ